MLAFVDNTGAVDAKQEVKQHQSFRCKSLHGMLCNEEAFDSNEFLNCEKEK